MTVIDQAEFEHLRRRDGEKREEEEVDRSGMRAVAKELIAVASVEEENDRGAEDHGPVTPDAEPVPQA